MKLTLGFSPCPNDTFIFDALVNQKIDTGGLEFEPVLEDVETLNEWAIEGRLDITKLSIPALFRSSDHYLLLNSGSALGKGVGPLLISNQPEPLSDEAVNDFLIALPGEHTTAHFLFQFAYPEARNKVYMRFDTIEEFLLKNLDALGVIIHENRFTYQEKGLHKVKDLGEYWEEKTGGPIPLGGIAINQSVKRSIALKVDKLIRKSVEYAFDNYPAIPGYVKEHAQTMHEDVMRKHINLYVNQFSIELGYEGKRAIEKMFSQFIAIYDMEPASAELLFL